MLQVAWHARGRQVAVDHSISGRHTNFDFFPSFSSLARGTRSELMGRQHRILRFGSHQRKIQFTKIFSYHEHDDIFGVILLRETKTKTAKLYFVLNNTVL